MKLTNFAGAVVFAALYLVCGLSAHRLALGSFDPTSPLSWALLLFWAAVPLAGMAVLLGLGLAVMALLHLLVDRQ